MIETLETTRRRFLQALGVGAAALALPLTLAGRAKAANTMIVRTGAPVIWASPIGASLKESRVGPFTYDYHGWFEVVFTNMKVRRILRVTGDGKEITDYVLRSNGSILFERLPLRPYGNRIPEIEVTAEIERS